METFSLIFSDGLASAPMWVRLLAFALVAGLATLLVLAIRFVADHIIASRTERKYSKLRSVTSMAASATIFTVYFLTVGFVLREFGVSLTAYMASASVIGLAIGFGSQGVVQDVVNGVTFIFSDLLDVGDLVEISTQIGIVKNISMRFVELENPMGASVFIPNRTITNVINYPRGYIRCIVDVTLTGDAATRDVAEERATSLMHGFHEQFPGIFLSRPSNAGRVRLSSGREFVRIKFRIWPGRSQPIETIYREEVVANFLKTDPDYKSWMVAVSFEVEDRPEAVKPSLNLSWPGGKPGGK
ncbi:mechanosensitive ion channel family protein [Maricaulis sp.]|uniref:mechanosensitive ion channel family protein n=1 Tax=Maricaulis sp. TaxID=1486257 RepID=UPI003A8E3D23